ncbi:hypothetical protein WJX73_000771 [Symbiochloris irregularis]|uniref:Uncharacterized protein n=1 Tax=Symbiochloris irregularis TaxID=706552 RepID=A0AAW1NQV5_9CHLO
MKGFSRRRAGPQGTSNSPLPGKSASAAASNRPLAGSALPSSGGGGVPNEGAAIQWQQMSPADAAAMIASKPSQLAMSMLRQGNFEEDCNSSLQQSRELLVDIMYGRRSITTAESAKVAEVMQNLESLLARSLERQTAWVAGCQQWEQALFAHVRYTEQVVHAACAARQEARGQLTLSRARQAAHEASLAEKDASIAQLKRKVKNLEAQRESEIEPNDHFSASSWLKMLQSPS